MKRRRTLVSLLLCALPLAAQSPQPAPVALHKGVNIWPMLYRARSVDNKGETFLLDNTFPYAKLYTRERLTALHALGFDYIRIQLEPTPFLTSPPADHPRLLAQVLAAVELAKSAGLNTVVVPFPRDILPRWSVAAILASPESSKLIGDLLVELATTLDRSNRANAVLETLNEPPGGYSAADNNRWSDLQLSYVKAIRRVAPTLTLLVTGDHGGSPDGLVRLDPKPIDDPRILYSFHYYNPMVFTHQQAAKKSRPYITGLAYPPVPTDAPAALASAHAAIAKAALSPVDAATITAHADSELHKYFDTPQDQHSIAAAITAVADWARLRHIAPSRIVLGEFGVYRPGASAASDAAWTTDVRTLTERAGFSWCFFDYNPDPRPPDMNILQITGPTPTAFDPAILAALGLSIPAVSIPTPSAIK